MSSVEARASDSLKSLITIVRPTRIAEFGSWEGRSALAFLEIGEHLGVDTQVLCIDTWLGSREHWRNVSPNSEWSFGNLRVEAGEPRVIDTFKEALSVYLDNGRASLLRAPIDIACVFLRGQRQFFDLVYVDADHSYSAVRRDLEDARSILVDGGVLAGDDWSWNSVRLAVAVGLQGSEHLLRSSDMSTYVILSGDARELLAAFESAGWVEVSRAQVFLRETPRLAQKFLVRPLRREFDKIYMLLGIKKFLTPIRSKWLRKIPE